VLRLDSQRKTLSNPYDLLTTFDNVMNIVNYSLRLTIIISLAFFLFLKIIITLEYQCSIYYFFHYYTLIY